ncbi:uncharacterized protein LOC122260943 [Penaeus japonicus]|uniref:uncharacterized protein LOC122260943 n=1 Tax=Penaeus japonicus TaxID=27405 RepID=UPI001C7171F6|nr:uncharacterized protein LOC122260943 [Penaeus japonicus]
MKYLMVAVLVVSLAAFEEVMAASSRDSGTSLEIQHHAHTHRTQDPAAAAAAAAAAPPAHRKEKVRHAHRLRERFHGKKKLHRVHFLDYRRGFISDPQPLKDEAIHIYEKPQRDSGKVLDQAYFWSYSGIGTPSDLWQQAIRVLPSEAKVAKPKPVAMPVTENLKRDPDPVAYYGLPKELMPIHPGGGSKFDDLEKERLERAKLAHTKDAGDDTENGASHDAEGLYSSADFPLLSLPTFVIACCARFFI